MEIIGGLGVLIVAIGSLILVSSVSTNPGSTEAFTESFNIFIKLFIIGVFLAAVAGELSG